jgi:hypothetical protein
LTLAAIEPLHKIIKHLPHKILFDYYTLCLMRPKIQPNPTHSIELSPLGRTSRLGDEGDLKKVQFIVFFQSIVATSGRSTTASYHSALAKELRKLTEQF